MGRILLILSAGCLAITFLMVWKIPFDPSKIYSYPRRKAQTAHPAKDTDSKSKPDTPHATRIKRKAKAGPYKAAGKDDKKTNVPEPEATLHSGDGQDSSQSRVKSDSAAVYSLNSSDSDILKLLKRGDRVDTDLEVIDEEGRWSLVKGGGDKRSGYVRSKNLETRQSPRRKN